MLFDNIIVNTFRIYFKNIVVNLFFSALMLLMPYLQYWLIINGIQASLSVLCVCLVAFLSAIFVYVPFIISIHKARITELWRTILRDVIILAAWWAVLCAVFFFAMLYFIETALLPPIASILICAIAMFAVWQVVILKTVNIVFNATDESGMSLSLSAVIWQNKRIFVAAFLFGAVAGFAIPVMWEAKKQANLARFPELENPMSERHPALVLTADEATLAEMFLLFPVLAIVMHECYRAVVAKMGEND